MEKNQLQEIIKNCKSILETDQIKELQNQIPQYSWILLLKLFVFFGYFLYFKSPTISYASS